LSCIVGSILFYKVSVSFHKDFIEVKEDEIEIGIMSKPVKGQANYEIIRKISKKFAIPKSNIRIVSGEKSRNKVIEITTDPKVTNPKK